ncbi:hypothetical protein BHE74_00019301 [Ensete ventricosum]|nr:hypothetical protein GW17_00011232 [Ensete ventricosum]RWW72864.1 hypothetical protein BHE74_00019301 [Ensete ventricosum]
MRARHEQRKRWRRRIRDRGCHRHVRAYRDITRSKQRDVWENENTVEKSGVVVVGGSPPPLLWQGGGASRSWSRRGGRRHAALIFGNNLRAVADLN